MTLNINSTAKTSVTPLWESYKKDAAANKLVSAMEGNENIDFAIVEDTEKDDKLTTLELVGDNIEDTNVKVRVNADDIARVAKEKGIDKDVFLSQQIASVMSATYLMTDAIKKGKDPSKYLSNAEFLVATNLMADGVVRRTLGKEDPNSKKDDQVRAYLDKERTQLPERIKAEHDENGIATGGGDALEVAEALGFVGINTGGWADKIVKGFGEKPDLETLEETTKSENDDNDDSTVSDSDSSDTTETTDTETATKDAEKKSGTNWLHLLLAGALGVGGGVLASRFLGPKASNDDKKKSEKLAKQLEDQQKVLKALAQQREQQRKAQADYQQKLKDYYAKLAVANTPAPTVPAPTLPVATMPYAQGFPLTYASSPAFSSVPNLASYPLPTVASSVQLPAPISNDWA
jgi:hypothetical protein